MPALLNTVSAIFVYDGDGRRVAQTLNGVTTYFVGSYYEVTGSTITKYYYAGMQRIAMRKGGTLYFMLSDHLGSTSLTTDASGNVISELRYTAWGEVRYNSGVTPTQYQYTGQIIPSPSVSCIMGQGGWMSRWGDLPRRIRLSLAGCRGWIGMLMQITTLFDTPIQLGIKSVTTIARSNTKEQTLPTNTTGKI